MSGWIIFLVWIGLFLTYFIVEFVISIFFTFKIKHVSNDEYTKAAFSGSMSTFLFMFMTLLAAFFSAQAGFIDDYFFESAILMLFWTTLSLSIGNFVATISIPKIQKIIKKIKNKKDK